MTGGGCAINPKAFLMGLGVAYAIGAVSAEAVGPSADQWMDPPSTEASPDGSIIIEPRLVIDAVSLQVSSEGFCVARARSRSAILAGTIARSLPNLERSKSRIFIYQLIS
jgi:hypothetical protein